MEIIKKWDKYWYLEVIKEWIPKILSWKKFRTVTCECTCGEIKDIRLDKLRQGRVKSCWCKQNQNTIIIK